MGLSFSGRSRSLRCLGRCPCARLNGFVVFKGHSLIQFVVFWLTLSKWFCRFLGVLEASAALIGALSGLDVALISATFTHDKSI